MKTAAFLLCSLCATLSPVGQSFAMGCTGVTYEQLMQRLKDVKFPLFMLAKVHTDKNELKAQGGFTSCPPREIGQTDYIYISRPVNDAPVRKFFGIEFSLYDYPNTTVRQKEFEKKFSADKRDQDALRNSADPLDKNYNIDVFYFLDPESTKMFRVERSFEPGIAF